MRILQINCQGAKEVMCELGAHMREDGYRIAMVQEPYAPHGRVLGLPADMRTFIDRKGRAAIIINDIHIQCQEVLSNEWGVCVCCEGDFGKIIICSSYFKFS